MAGGAKVLRGSVATGVGPIATMATRLWRYGADRSEPIDVVPAQYRVIHCPAGQRTKPSPRCWTRGAGRPGPAISGRFCAIPVAGRSTCGDFFHPLEHCVRHRDPFRSSRNGRIWIIVAGRCTRTAQPGDAPQCHNANGNADRDGVLYRCRSDSVFTEFSSCSLVQTHGTLAGSF